MNGFHCYLVGVLTYNYRKYALHLPYRLQQEKRSSAQLSLKREL